MKAKERHNAQRISIGALAAGLLLGALLAGCATTVEAPPQALKAVESGASLPPDITSFFGADNAAKLAPGPKGGAALVWINPSTQWGNYNKVLLQPVQFWASADSKVPAADQQT